MFSQKTEGLTVARIEKSDLFIQAAVSCLDANASQIPGIVEVKC